MLNDQRIGRNDENISLVFPDKLPCLCVTFPIQMYIQLRILYPTENFLFCPGLVCTGPYHLGKKRILICHSENLL